MGGFRSGRIPNENSLVVGAVAEQSELDEGAKDEWRGRCEDARACLAAGVAGNGCELVLGLSYQRDPALSRRSPTR
jgi:hypothetical protein